MSNCQAYPSNEFIVGRSVIRIPRIVVRRQQVDRLYFRFKTKYDTIPYRFCNDGLFFLVTPFKGSFKQSNRFVNIQGVSVRRNQSKLRFVVSVEKSEFWIELVGHTLFVFSRAINSSCCISK